MKIPTTKQLTKTAIAYNNRQFKKGTVKALKALNKHIKKLSETGKTHYSRTFTDNGKFGEEYYIAMRWYRRFSGLQVTIAERTTTSETGRRYIDEMDVKIEWD